MLRLVIVSGYLRFAKSMAIFRYKIIVFQGQFSILSAFSIEQLQKQLAFRLQFAASTK